MEVGSRWGAEGWFFHILEQKAAINCVFMKAQKGPQCTCQAKMVSGSNFTPSLASLVHPRSTIYPTVDFQEFTRS